MQKRRGAGSLQERYGSDSVGEEPGGADRGSLLAFRLPLKVGEGGKEHGVEIACQHANRLRRQAESEVVGAHNVLGRHQPKDDVVALIDSFDD